MDLIRRQNSLVDILINSEIDAILLTKPANIRYITGFCGSSAYVVLHNRGLGTIITDGRYLDEASGLEGFEVIIATGRFSDELGSICNKYAVTRLGLEAEHVSYFQFECLQKKLAPVELVPLIKTIEQMREIKDEDEIMAIRQAIGLTEQAMRTTVANIFNGATELELAAMFEYESRVHGSEGLPFDTIVASNERAANPHAQPTTAKISEGAVIKIDCGSKISGYCSDITRTFFLDSVSDEQRRIYGVVSSALEAAITATKPGVTLSSIDRTARAIIEDSGYGQHFIHGLGHGLGLDVHEAPNVSDKSPTVAKKGMVFTIEPGIYLIERFGIRIEEIVAVTDAGCEVLTTYPRQLSVLKEGIR